VLSGEVTPTNVIVYGFTQPRLEPTIYPITTGVYLFAGIEPIYNIQGEKLEERVLFCDLPTADAYERNTEQLDKDMAKLAREETFQTNTLYIQAVSILIRLTSPVPDESNFAIDPVGRELNE
jgi:hypothetical protein